jgi:DNA-directed RNA polymerase subunit H (RpoH/RPB5)
MVMNEIQSSQLYKDLGMDSMAEPWINTKDPLWILWCEYCRLIDLKW